MRKTLFVRLAFLPVALACASTLACPAPAAVNQAEMLGLWRAEFEGLPGATLLLEKHPEFAQSLRGAINRNGERGLVAGDMEDGELVLEESADGQRISATFVGNAVEGSCGKEIRGMWEATGEKPRPFVLRRHPREGGDPGRP